MKVGVFTGGGPAPGLNAVLFHLAYRCHEQCIELIGIENGGAGFLKKECRTLDYKSIPLGDGGTILGTSRTNLEKHTPEVKATIESLKLDGIVAIGGDDTLRSAGVIGQFVPCVLIGKTIDNDLPEVDRTLGSKTFAQCVAREATALELDARSTRRIYITEVMGRDSGAPTFAVFASSRASMALIPEEPFTIASLTKHIEGMKRQCGVLLVAEGADDRELMQRYAAEKLALRDGLAKAGIAQAVIDQHFPAPEFDAFGNAKKESIADIITLELKRVLHSVPFQRVPNLGYQYRSANPVKEDLDLAEALAKEALEALNHGNRGIMVGEKRGEITSVPLADIVGKKRALSRETFEPYLIEGGLLVKGGAQ